MKKLKIQSYGHRRCTAVLANLKKILESKEFGPNNQTIGEAEAQLL